MKKLGLIGLGLIGLISIGTSNVMAKDIIMSDMNYFWNVKDKKCEKAFFKDKAITMKDIERGDLIVDQKYDNDAGTVVMIAGEDSKTKEEFTITTFSNYQVCRFYEDLIIKKMDVKAKQYINVVEPGSTTGNKK